MKSYKSRVFREPGIIKWIASVPPGPNLKIYVLYSKDGNKWEKTGPYLNPTGSRLGFNLPGKVRLHIEGAMSGTVPIAISHLVIHFADDVLEFGGNAGW